MAGYLSEYRKLRKSLTNPRFILSLRLFLGCTFLVSAVSKLLSPSDFIAAVVGYNLLPQGLAVLYGSILPWIELLAGILLIFGRLVKLSSGISLAMIVSFMAANIQAIIFTQADQNCGCFGNSINMGHTASLALDIPMLLASLHLLITTNLSGSKSRRGQPPIMKLDRSVFQAASRIVPVIMAVVIATPATLVLSPGHEARASSSRIITSQLTPVRSQINNALESGRKAFLYFYREGCPSCERQAPIIDNLEQQYNQGIEFVRLNANIEMQASKEFGVSSVPSVFLISGRDNGGKYLTQTFKGLTGEDTLRQALESAIIDSTSGLLGYWKLNEGSGTTARDSSGLGNNGTIKGTPLWLNWEASGTTGSLSGAVLRFDGTSNHVITPIQFSQLSNGMTWMAWARHDDKTMTWSWVFSEDSNDDSHSQIGKIAGSGEVRFELQGVGTIDTNGVNIADGQSHHIAGVWEKGVGLKIYIDGTLKASGNFIASLTAKKAIRIGAKNDAWPAEKWKGLIGNANIFNRALTPPEIQSVMSGAIETVPSPTSSSSLTAPVSLNWVDFGQDKVDRNASKPNSVSDGHFRVNLNINGSKSVQRMVLYTSDTIGNPALLQYWESGPISSNWILGVFRNGALLNAQQMLLNDPVSGQASYDVYGEDSGYFKSGQFFGITVTFTDGTSVKAVTSIGGSGTTTTPPTSAAPPASTPLPGTAPVSLNWVDFGQDKVDRNASKPNSVSDGHFRVNLNVSGSKSVQRMVLYTSDTTGNPALLQYWESGPISSNWILGVFRNGALLNAQQMLLNDPVSGQASYDVYGEDSGYFKSGQFFGITVTFTDGTSVKAVTSIGGSGTTTTPPTSAAPPASTPLPGTAPVSLNWVDFGQDKVDRNASKPNSVSDGHFRVNLNVSGSKSVQRMVLYTSDTTGNPALLQYWESGPISSNWILGVFRNGALLNAQQMLLNDPVSGQASYDVYGEDSGYFKSGQFFGITVTFTDGTSVKAVTSIGGSGTTTTPPTSAAPPASTPLPGTAPVSLNWVDFGQDKVDRNASKPNSVSDGHFRVNLNVSGSKSVQRMVLYTSDTIGNPALLQYWESGPISSNWILGVFRNGALLNAQQMLLNDPVSGQASYDVYGEDSGYFKSGQFFGITVTFTDGTSVKAVTSIGGSGTTTTPPTSAAPTGSSTIPGTNSPLPPFGNPQPANSQRMSIQVAQRRVMAGELVQVPVWLVTASNVANINFELSFNIAVAKPEGTIPKGNLIDNSLFSVNPNETAIIRAGFAGTAGVSGTGTVMTVPFRVVGKPGDRTQINVSVSVINDPSGKALTIDRIPGEIVILNADGTLPGASGTPATAGLPPGDCDGDGVLTFLDAVCALEMSVKLKPARLLLDLDKSGDVTSRDATIIAQKVVGKP